MSDNKDYILQAKGAKRDVEHTEWSLQNGFTKVMLKIGADVKWSLTKLV